MYLGVVEKDIAREIEYVTKMDTKVEGGHQVHVGSRTRTNMAQCVGCQEQSIGYGNYQRK